MIKMPESRKRKAFVANVIQSLVGKLREFAAGDELFREDDADVERIARDIGITGHELRALAQMPANRPLLLYQRLAALHLDPNDDARIQSAVLRDLQVHCAMCPDKKRCAGDFAVRTLDATWQDYCPNAHTLRALVAAGPVSGEIEDLIIYLNTVGKEASTRSH
jgi:hypothetical protein